MKQLMSDTLLKQLLNKMSSLESRVQFLEGKYPPSMNNPDPSYWQVNQQDMRFTGVDRIQITGYQPVVSGKPPKER